MLYFSGVCSFICHVAATTFFIDISERGSLEVIIYQSALSAFFILEGLPLTISYHLYFLSISKVWSTLH